MNNIKVLIILLAIIAFFVLFVGGIIPYFIFYVVLLASLIPLIHNLIILKKIKGTIKIPTGTLYSGDKIDIYYEINNNSNFYIPHMEIKSHIVKQLTGKDSPKIITSLNPKKSFTFKETVILKKRGYYELGEIQITIKDIFGLYSLNKNFSTKASLLVYPETIELSTFKIIAVEQSGELMVKDPTFQDKSRIASIRDYREGDSIKSIHWKLTAKLDQPIIKEYENRGDTRVSMFIDNYQKHFLKDVDRRLEDKIAEVALSIINYYINRNIYIELRTQYQNEIVQIQGEQKYHIKSFLDFLAKFKGNGSIDFNTFITPQLEILKKDTTAIIITPCLDKSTGTLGIFLKTKNINPLFIIITDKENNTGHVDLSVEEILRQEGIPLYLIDYNSNIKKILEEQNE